MRSPVAPKMISVHGSASESGGLASGSDGTARTVAITRCSPSRPVEGASAFSSFVQWMIRSEPDLAEGCCPQPTSTSKRGRVVCYVTEDGRRYRHGLPCASVMFVEPDADDVVPARGVVAFEALVHARGRLASKRLGNHREVLHEVTRRRQMALYAFLGSG